MRASIEFLSSVPLFANLNAAILAELSSRMQYRAFGSGMTLFHQDMPGSTLYLLAEGFIRIYSIGQTGLEFTHYVYGPGEIFGELSLLDDGFHSATCITMTPIKTWMLSREHLFRILQDHPPVMRQMLTIVSQRVRAATKKSEAMAFQDVQGRLAYELFRLEVRMNASGGERTLASIPLAQHELASMVGATRESVNKALAVFRAQDLIKISGTSITILDLAGLEKFFTERGR